MAKHKLIIFDMEGTIFNKAVPLVKTIVAPSVWMAIAESLGKKALQEERQTQEKYISGQYSSYIEWMEETILIHKKYNLTEKQFRTIIDKIKYTPGVHEVFNIITSKGVPTCLISGGFKYQADKAVRDFRIKHSFVGCEYFWDQNGFLFHWNLLPADEQGKLNFTKVLIAEYRLSNDDCIFIGDGKNDVAIAKEMGVSIAFNAQEELKKVATYSIEQQEGKEDFRAILEYLNI